MDTKSAGILNELEDGAVLDHSKGIWHGLEVGDIKLIVSGSRGSSPGRLDFRTKLRLNLTVTGQFV